MFLQWAQLNSSGCQDFPRATRKGPLPRERDQLDPKMKVFDGGLERISSYICLVNCLISFFSTGMVELATCTETEWWQRGREARVLGRPSTRSNLLLFSICLGFGGTSDCITGSRFVYIIMTAKEKAEMEKQHPNNTCLREEQNWKNLEMLILKNNDFMRGFSLSSPHMMSCACFSTLVNVSNSASNLITESELDLISCLKLVGRLLFHSNMTN